MIPLKITFLWHFHQPYYRQHQILRLPWVRFHGVKDYLTIPQWFASFPDITMTFNITPSLVDQIRLYNGGFSDTIWQLSSYPADELTDTQKTEIIQKFFLCNYNRMIQPYARYDQLWQARQQALQSFTAQDWRDLQVWYNLTWTAPLKQEEPVLHSLFQKGANFSEHDKEALLALYRTLLQRVIPTWQALAKQPNVRFSVSAFYHPILPLLCDTNIASESAPDISLPDPPFRYPEDAEQQILQAVRFFQSLFHYPPSGFWPPEGGVSQEVLKLLIRAGLQWCATDVQILRNSIPNASPLAGYFPYRMSFAEGHITIFFRDSTLSDLIGFVYSQWEANEAVADFLHRLRQIRNQLIETYGEARLDDAVVTIILDGENCWEYYPNNGYEFIHRLCEQLSRADDLTTVAFDELINSTTQPLDHLIAGSWINADFRIWIGSPEDNQAWNLLHDARSAANKVLSTVSPSIRSQILHHLFVAEGSDWFWWYGEDHSSESDADFDALFRWNLQQVYQLSNLPIPPALASALETEHSSILSPPRGKIAPALSGKRETIAQWNQSGYYDVPSIGGVMHRATDLIRRLRYGTDGQMLYLRCETSHPLGPEESIILAFRKPQALEILFSHQQCLLRTPDNTLRVVRFSVVIDEVIDCSIDLQTLGCSGSTLPPIQLHIITQTPAGTTIYPPNEPLTLDIS